MFHRYTVKLGICAKTFASVVINRQDYDNKQGKHHKEEKTNRTKIVIEAMMTMKLVCITVLLWLFFEYRTS